jgi:phosphoserine/homoserine phosphotransferase
MNLVCLDLEGVLVPEIWLNVAAKTGIDALKRTTRDEPDYSKLMAGRIEILQAHNLTLKDIQEVISTMDSLPGALDFLNQLRSNTQVVILSDTFEQFAQPLMKQLAWPTLFCNQLVVNAHGTIIDFKLRQQDGKKKAVAGFQSMGLRVTAAGDSYNDLTMIKLADRGALFRPPASIIEEEPELPVFNEYQEFFEFLVEME